MSENNNGLCAYLLCVMRASQHDFLDHRAPRHQREENKEKPLAIYISHNYTYTIPYSK